MFWNKIRKELIKLNADFDSWSEQYMVIDSHDSICGLKGFFPNGNDFSVVSHKHSYGGEYGEFEILSTHFKDEEEVKGFLTEEEAIQWLQELSK